MPQYTVYCVHICVNSQNRQLTDFGHCSERVNVPVMQIAPSMSNWGFKTHLLTVVSTGAVNVIKKRDEINIARH